MPNSYFQFKQFRIDQDQCAMKVSTEACLFGALIDPGEATKLLDIGAGTGVLSLMIAQRSFLHVDAVEIDELASEQAKRNVARSKYSSRVKVHTSSIQAYSCDVKYDIIVSNPPFYTDGYKAVDQRRNRAMRAETLKFDELANSVNRLLKIEGVFWVLLPEHEMDRLTSLLYQMEFEKIADISIFNRTSDQRIFRKVAAFTRNKLAGLQESTICIRDDNNRYSRDFVNLLKEYYLYL